MTETEKKEIIDDLNAKEILRQKCRIAWNDVQASNIRTPEGQEKRKLWLALDKEWCEKYGNDFDCEY